MRLASFFLFAGLFLLTLSITSVRAEEQDLELVEESEEVEINAENSAPADDESGGNVIRNAEDDEPKYYVTDTVDVDSSFVLHKRPGNVLYPGEHTELLVGFHNLGADTYNLTHIYATLLHPKELTYHVENYTAIGYYDLLQSGDFKSFSYFFNPNEYLQVREDFGFAAIAFFQKPTDNNPFRIYRHIIFNGTMAVVERETAFDADLLFAYAGVGAIGLAVLFGLYKIVSKAARKGGKRRLETGTRSSEVSDEWLEGTHAAMHGKKRR
eukprot:CAMPEP_0177658580 /NCGR_PEP_ID=MMETSP0447-20121125/16897_1 /TAXON_ID=0 /ORGANISM="Stygamoeba regulata, Strain BSH-02190019" /LENGTH=267 /DNA_ID=CAMNT_0019163217 /DNA_START=44 /DNA_END=847 /DNA_ORIENTATION=+